MEIFIVLVVLSLIILNWDILGDFIIGAVLFCFALLGTAAVILVVATQ